MPSIESPSESLGAAGLINAAALNAITDTLVGIWDLSDVKDDVPEAAEALSYQNPGDESVVGTDERERVANADILPGGKYRCECSS